MCYLDCFEHWLVMGVCEYIAVKNSNMCVYFLFMLLNYKNKKRQKELHV